MTGSPEPEALGAADGLPRLTLRREVLRATLASGTYAAADGLARAVSLLLTLLYTRFLSPSDYGTLAITSTVILLLTPVLSLSITAAVTRLWFEPRTELERRRLIATVLAFLLVVPTILLALIEVAGQLGLLDVFEGARYDPYLRYAVLTAYCSMYLDLPVSVYIVLRKPRRVLLLSVANALLTLGVSLLLVAVLDEGVLGVLRAGLIASGVMAAVAVVLTLRMTVGARRPSRPLLRASIAFSLPLVPAALAQWVLQVSDRPILSHYVSANEVGQYYVGYSVGAVCALAVQGVSRALGPIVTRDLKEDARQRVVRLATYALLGLVLVCLGVALFGRDALTLIVSSEFHQAPRVVPVIALAYVAFAIYAIVTQGIWYGMQTRLVPALTFAASIVNVGLNLLLIPRFGILAAAWDTVAGFSALALFQGVLAYHVFRIDWEYGRWAKAVAAAGAAYAAGSAAGSDLSVARVVAEVLAIVVVFPAALTILRFWTPTERRLLRRRLAAAAGR